MAAAVYYARTKHNKLRNKIERKINIRRNWRGVCEWRKCFTVFSPTADSLWLISTVDNVHRSLDSLRLDDTRKTARPHPFIYISQVASVFRRFFSCSFFCLFVYFLERAQHTNAALKSQRGQASIESQRLNIETIWNKHQARGVSATPQSGQYDDNSGNTMHNKHTSRLPV